MEHPRQNADTTTVLVYNDPEPDILPPPSRPASVPIRPSEVHDEPPLAPTNQPTPPVQSPVLAHPPPAADYRKMGSVLSPTSRTTMTGTTFSSDPSFSSEINPVKRFFHTLYRMPWIAHGRVTVAPLLETQSVSAR